MSRIRLIPAMIALATGISIVCGVCAVYGVSEASAASAQPAPQNSSVGAAPIQPRAIELLQAMCDRLAHARSMSFTADVNYEYPSRLGPPIAYAMRYQVTMKRPDKLKVVMPGDGPPSEFYYDGKQMTAYAPAEDLAAVASAPPVMDEALRQAFEQADIYFPFTDLIVADPYDALVKDVKLAFVVGPSKVAGNTETQSVVLADDDVFLQIWIGTSDMLPRRIRAVYSADPLRLRHDMELSGWKIDQPVASGAFVSKKARSAKSIGFARPLIPSAPGAEAAQSGGMPDPGAPNASNTPQ